MTLTSYKRNPGQERARRELLTTGKRFPLVFGGSRSGKTFEFVGTVIERALLAPKSRHLIVRQEATSAKRAIVKGTWPEVMAMRWPGLGWEWKEQYGYFALENGSEVWVGGLNDEAALEKILGTEYVTIYLNEASEVRYSAFTLLRSRLAQQVATIKGDNLSQRFYVDLNPTNSAHWTYQLWIAGVDPVSGAAVDRSDFGHITINPMDNAANLSPEYLKDLQNLPELARKRFFDGVYGADAANALWRRQYIKRVVDMPAMARVVVAVDPAVSAEVGSDETGIVVVGLGVDGNGYVLADESGKYRPEEWAARAISMYHTYDADRIVAEVNQGGDMVESVIRAQAQNVSYRSVHASRGKVTRAEPIAALYERGKVFHAGEFQELESQMCSFTTGFDRKAQGYSPDRCLVAGTMIETDSGPKPIESICVGDMVWTRKGLRIVTASGMTGRSAHVIGVRTVEGDELVGTGNHPVYVEGCGFAAMDSLVWGDKFSHIEDNDLWQKSRQFSSTAWIIFATRKALASLRQGISILSQMGAGLGQRPCTALYGSFTTALSRKDGTYIMSTGTGQIMILPTLSQLTLLRIALHTKHCTPRSSKRGAVNVLNMLAGLHQNGTEARRVLNSTVGLGSWLGQTVSQMRACASNAGLHMRQWRDEKPTGFAQGYAQAVTTKLRDGITRTVLASFVVAVSTLRKVTRSKHAHAHVAKFFAAPRQDVFNLTVEGENEYYANGILVHNCDALVWALTDLFPAMVAKPPVAHVAPMRTAMPMARR